MCEQVYRKGILIIDYGMLNPDYDYYYFRPLVKWEREDYVEGKVNPPFRLGLLVMCVVVLVSSMKMISRFRMLLYDDYSLMIQEKEKNYEGMHYSVKERMTKMMMKWRRRLLMVQSSRRRWWSKRR